MLKVLHNNSCSKSRAVLEHLDENNVQFEIIDLVDSPLSSIELRTLLRKLDCKASELTRIDSAEFQQKFDGKNFTEEEYFHILLENPHLIQRPILISESVAMICRPIENVRFFIEN